MAQGGQISFLKRINKRIQTQSGNLYYMTQTSKILARKIRNLKTYTHCSSLICWLVSEMGPSTLGKFWFDLFFGRSGETPKPSHCNFFFAASLFIVTDVKTNQKFQNTLDRKYNNGMLLLHRNSPPPPPQVTFYRNQFVVLPCCDEESTVAGRVNNFICKTVVKCLLT